LNFGFREREVTAMPFFGFGRGKKPPPRRTPRKKITFDQALDEVK